MKRLVAFLLILAVSTSLFSFEEPIFYVNNVDAGNNYTVKDFYVYNYSDTRLEAFARLHYSGLMWRDFVKMTVSFFKDGEMVGSDYNYIDYTTYGSYGMWPGSETLITYFFEKVDFDSVFFLVSYSSRDGEPKFNKNAIAVLSTAIEPPTYGTQSTVSGLIKNISGVSIKYPKVFICVYRADKMILFDYDYADAPDYALDPLQLAAFEAYVDLPAQYDSIKYLPNYNVSSTGDIVISDINAATAKLLPTSFCLSQNYPNPFNSSTTIRFSIDRSQRVKLELFDTSGKSVITVLENDYPPGEYSARIDASQLASGCYIVVLSGDSQVMTKKMMLVQ